MKRNAVLGALLLATALTTGCVDRKFVVTSEPLNAAVYVNGNYIGQTPVDYPFIYYGKYEFRIVKDGYETLVERKQIAAPWYEIPPLDFVSDIFFPYEIRDVRRIHYALAERVPPRETDVLQRATNLRERGKAIGAPRVDGALPPGTLFPGREVPTNLPPATPAPGPAGPPAPPLFPGAPAPGQPG
jgi:hypothetical protein